MSKFVHVQVLQIENIQDMVRTHILHMIIGRTICAMDILDHPMPLKMCSFSIHMPMAMCVMVLHARSERTAVTKILQVSTMYLYRQST